MSLLLLAASALFVGGLRLATFVVSWRRDDYADPVGAIFQAWFAPRRTQALALSSLKRIDHR